MRPAWCEQSEKKMGGSMSSELVTVQAAVVADPAIHGGEPILEGTATTVRAIVELWNQGMPPEEVPVHLPHLHLAQVFEALRFYLTHRAEIDKHIAANRIPEGWHGRRFDPRTGTTL